jgi:hypothetical protein
VNTRVDAIDIKELVTRHIHLYSTHSIRLGRLKRYFVCRCMPILTICNSNYKLIEIIMQRGERRAALVPIL